ncbi:hypothetical protein SAMN05421829_1243 [Aromatoleum tolulyticum]|uniref:Uncharacterized protein n=1 Tax=Aromatoleum tolulyticum TaxID=34027 RepID=A0A1N7CFG9_9RHOO|nr:hypothetical protein SAMN05421829_1243 [Aromatoleum tolulyticum]
MKLPRQVSTPHNPDVFSPGGHSYLIVNIAHITLHESNV